MWGRVLAFVAAVLIHGTFLLLGGLFFLRGDESKKKVGEVELVSEIEEAGKPEDKKDDSKDAVAEEPMRAEDDAPPDIVEEMAKLQQQPGLPATPALEALSLGDLGSLLDPGAAGGEAGFGGSFGLQSGGRIGGVGAVGPEGVGSGEGNPNDAVFAIADLDERPRALFQPTPVYPHALRSGRAEGTVYVLFVVDQAGKVMNPRVEKSSHEAFERPALEAVRQWKFQPATRLGQRVACRIRVPIRFTV